MHHRSAELNIHSDEAGAGLVEYALLLALIFVVCLGAVTMFGQESSDMMIDTSDCISQGMNQNLGACPGN